jgi:hypothetical protein
MSKACVRCAMGASVLSTMLLIGSSAAVAVADPDTGSPGPAAQSQGIDSSEAGAESPGTSAAGTSTRRQFDLRSSIRESVLGVRTALRAATTQRGAVDREEPLSAGALTDGDVDPLEAALTVPESPTGEIEAVIGDSTVAPSGSITPYVAGSSSTSPASEPAAAVPAPAAKVSTVKAPLLFHQLPKVAHTVGNTVATVLNETEHAVGAVPTLLLGLPTSTTPVTDVITTIEVMLTSVGNSVGAIVTLPNELGALMGVPGQPVAVVGAAPEARTMTLAGPVGLPGLMLPQLPVAELGSGTVISAPESPALPAITPVSAERIAPINEAPLGMSGLTASGAPESFLDRAVSTLLVPISIATLAAVALPGVGGLFVICALGIRIGYRQAKAGWAIRVAGIGRFAGSGPMGVVRSGSMITLHMPRAAAARKSGHLRLVDRSADQAA